MTEALEKTNRINLLLDFYEPLLTEKQQTVLRYYYHDNYSLGEISDLFEISRQAVFEHLKRAEQTLEDCESKLGLVEKHQARREALDALRRELEHVPGLRERLEPMLERIEQAE
ncbi:YlxM family DNA-binding protein [Paenibacillus thermoaerophilus]|uniref:UPF0122 protein ACFQWB_02385 n=1 Tax=Paenibacillus thermoaerophilus TaxID=1215385 RepID=A0ABW2V1U3_9BACL|nr:YlxM family DNA-binding protein [Paenibacillus thermoaerophilus]TMV19189.1 YlxM family DNA-binding protein [Paenibacillus thermoaerophilus]